MGVTIISKDECEHLFATQPDHWQGLPLGRAGVLPVTDTTRTHASQATTSVAHSPWWIHRSNEADLFTGLLLVEPDMPLFAGHFPDNPLLPGVVQIDWAITTAAAAFADLPASAFAGMSRIKFKAPVKPGALLKLNLSRADRQVRFTYLDHQGTCTEGRLQYGGAD